MTVQHTHKRDTSPRRRWLRAVCATCAVVLIAALALSGTAQEDSTGASRFFRLPNLFRSNTDESSPAPAQPDGRLLRRVRQLMSDSQQLESSGHSAAALEMARRAESVLSTATRTAGVVWPAGQRTPAEFAAMLEQKVRSTQQPAPASRQRPVLPAPSPAIEVPSSLGQTISVNSPQATPGPTARTVPGDKSGFLLNWGDRGRPETPPPASRASGAAPIQLLNGDEAPAADQPRAIAAPDQQTTDNLLDRLRSLDTWGTLGDATRENNSRLATPAEPRNRATGLPPVGGWQREINDGNVGPIPTQPPHESFEVTTPDAKRTVPTDPPGRLTVDGPAKPTPALPIEDEGPTDPIADSKPVAIEDVAVEIDEPARPQPTALADTEQTEPGPAAQPVTEAGQQPSLPTQTQAGLSQGNSGSGDSSLLMNAGIQVLATFVGVLLAILVFRAVAIRVWGPSMGLVVPVAQHASAASAADDSESGVVPFTGGNTDDSESEMHMPDPASIPFRLVGSSYEEERQADEQADKEREEAILKTVFQQNIELIDELQDMRKSA